MTYGWCCCTVFLRHTLEISKCEFRLLTGRTHWRNTSFLPVRLQQGVHMDFGKLHHVCFEEAGRQEVSVRPAGALALQRRFHYLFLHCLTAGMGIHGEPGVLKMFWQNLVRAGELIHNTFLKKSPNFRTLLVKTVFSGQRGHEDYTNTYNQTE